MKRIFGANKPVVPGVTLEEATKKADERANSLDDKIRKLDKELVEYREKLKKTKPGAAKSALQQRAVRVLKQKKMYEQQRDQLMSQSFNMEQANFATQTMKDTVVTVNAMKTANVELKKQLKTVNIDDIDNMQDDLSELLEMNNEIQESLSRSYATPDFDESELEDELASLGEELSMEETPSYLLAAAPSTDPQLEGVQSKSSVPLST